MSSRRSPRSCAPNSRAPAARLRRVLGRLVGPPALLGSTRIRLWLRQIRASSPPTEGALQVLLNHGGGGSRTRVHERSIKSLYVRRSL